MTMSKVVKLKCNKCGHFISIDCNNFPWEAVSKYKRNMGFEIEYERKIEFNCDNCNNIIELKAYCWEYPEGVVNHIESPKAQGATIITYECSECPDQTEKM